ncbi:MAG TPA: hypothetical protein VGL66_06675 [Caulobacteraceae bacterium]|jgi:hypothetical protein
MILRMLGLSVVAAMATAGATTVQAAPPSDAAACAAALDVVKADVEDHKSPRPWAVFGHAGSRDDGLTAAALRKAMKKDPPSADLATKFVSQDARDWTWVCSDVIAYLSSNRIAHNQMDLTQTILDAPEIFSLSLPVLSADGKEALADIAQSRGAHARGGGGDMRGWVVHLRKDAQGRWRQTDAFVNITG